MSHERAGVEARKRSAKVLEQGVVLDFADPAIDSQQAYAGSK
jgi:hypothetical protein